MKSEPGGDAPAYQWYPKDYLSSTPVMMMNLSQEGMYRRLLDYQWLNGWIPEEPQDLARLCRVSVREVAKLWPAVASCFVRREDGPGLVNLRLERERAKQLAYRERMNKAGKAGAEGRWGKTDRKPAVEESHFDRNAIASEAHCDSMALQFASAFAVCSTEEEGAAPPPAAEAAPPPKPSKKRSGWTPPDVPIPLELDTPAFRVAWEKRLIERAEPGIKAIERPTASSLAAQLDGLRRLAAVRGLAEAIAGVERATANRYRAVFFKEDFEPPRNGKPANGAADTRRGAGDQERHVPRPGGFNPFPDEPRTS